MPGALSEARECSGRVIHSAGSCSLLPRLSGKGASWAEHECESDSDGVTGTVTCILPVAVRWSYVLPSVLPPGLSERNKERSGGTESPVAALPQPVKGAQRAFAGQQGLPSPLGLLVVAVALPGCPAALAAWQGGHCTFPGLRGH